MTFKDLYKKLEDSKYYIFSCEDMRSFYPHEKKSTLNKMLYRWRAKGWIRSLKRGIYELVYPQERTIPDMYIANCLYSPSYVSLETALSKYSIIPEISMGVTSVTTKPTRRFKNKHGLFTYRTIKPDFFVGYLIERHGNFDILIAEPEKALVDFLFFKTLHRRKVDFVEERIDKKVVSSLDYKKLDKYAKIYDINLGRLYAYL